MAAPVAARLVASGPPPPAAASPNARKLSAPGTRDQNAASSITMAGGEVLIRAANNANGTDRNAQTKPERLGESTVPATAWASRATATEAISQNSDPGGAER